MRLFVLALAVPASVSALAQPALAREHARHHHWSRVAYSHRVAYVPRAAVDETRIREPSRLGSYESRSFAQRNESHGQLDAMIARHAQANGLPEALVHRVVIRESRYNPRAVGAGGAMGLMQIKYSTARAMGYTGSAAGLLDPDTNLTYAVRYLAGAYRVAGGSADRAVSNYARGYYAEAKRAGVPPYQQAPSSGSYASARPIERTAWASPRRESPVWSRAYGSARPVERVASARRTERLASAEATSWREMPGTFDRN